MNRTLASAAPAIAKIFVLTYPLQTTYIHTPTHLNDVELSVECRDKGMRKGLLMMGSCCIMNVEGRTTENVSKRVENAEGGCSSVFASRQQREQ